jgi:hypothetical protein
MPRPAKATLCEVREELYAGGCVRMVHAGGAVLIHADPEYHRLRPHQHDLIDGRSYHGFLRNLARECVRTETGSLETGDLVIEWRYPRKKP